MNRTYFSDWGGLPAQRNIIAGRAIFTDAYAFMPRRVQSDITVSLLPGWEGTRAWILARPLTGFAETFAELIVEMGPGGGTRAGEPDPKAQGVLFVLKGGMTLTVDGATHEMAEGGFAYLPPASDWAVSAGAAGATCVWIRKRYEPVPGLEPPEVLVTSDAAVTPSNMPDTEGHWSTTRFVDPADLRHDMHVTIVNHDPGAEVPFTETHVMEHGLLVLQGMGVYRLNDDWIEVEAGDFMWLRAFCPQGCHASGSETFRYLLYKDVNRHPRL